MSEIVEETIKRVKAAGKDYYKILGLPRDADETAIKKAYKKLALQLHPDKCKIDDAENCFKSVSAAYSCLSVESTRRNYDLTGNEGPVSNGDGAHPFHGVDPNEIFEQFFRQHGGMGGMGGPGVFSFSVGGPGVQGFNFASGNPFAQFSQQQNFPQQSRSIFPESISTFFRPILSRIPSQYWIIIIMVLVILIGKFLLGILSRQLYKVLLITTLCPAKFRSNFFLVLILYDFLTYYNILISIL